MDWLLIWYSYFALSELVSLFVEVGKPVNELVGLEVFEMRQSGKNETFVVIQNEIN